MARSCAAPLRRTGPPAGQRGRGGPLGTDGPSGPPGSHQGREGSFIFSVILSQLKVNLDFTLTV